MTHQEYKQRQEEILDEFYHMYHLAEGEMEQRDRLNDASAALDTLAWAYNRAIEQLEANAEKLGLIKEESK